LPSSRLPSLPPLHALKAFDAAARLGRFRDAALALGLSESAISHQIKRLEDYLGVALFARTGNSVTLSEAGRRYFDEIEPAFDKMRRATEAIRGPSDLARVALTLPGTLATFWLIPRLGNLEARHPDISLQLITTTRVVDLRREQIQLGIRYGRAPWPGLQSEHLLDEQAFPVCAPGLIDPAKTSPAQALRKLRIIVNDTALTEWQDWCAAHGLEPPTGRGAIVLHASDQTLGAALEGLGMAIGRRPLVDRWLDEGRLIAPFGSADRSGAAYYLVYPEGIELSAPARKVARWLRETASAELGNAEAGSAGRTPL
jgi:LysR family glycine cleavage system transcriptional activator